MSVFDNENPTFGLTIHKDESRASSHEQTMAFVFQPLSWYAEDIDRSEDDAADSEADSSSASSKGKKEKDHTILQYVIKAFGRTESGAAASLTITGFRPFFYVKLPDAWNPQHTEHFITSLKRMQCTTFGNLDLSETAVVQRKDLLGFTNFKEFKFLRLAFYSCKHMRFAAKFFLTKQVVCHELHTEPRFYKSIYESNIDPYLRFFHVRGLTPCGWITVSQGKSIQANLLESNCTLDKQAHAMDVQPFDRIGDAPFKILSFDLECYSETGDFPVAKRDYTQLSEFIYESHTSWAVNKPTSQYMGVVRMTRLIARSLGIDDPEFLGGSFSTADLGETTIDLAALDVPKMRFEVPQDSVSKKKGLATILARVVDDVMVALKPKPKAKEGVEEEEAKKPKPKSSFFGRKDKSPREMAIDVITRLLDKTLPRLVGDPIIQIGSTLHLHGKREVSLKHVFVLGKSSAFPCDFAQNSLGLRFGL